MANLACDLGTVALMLCAPIPDALGSNSLIRADNTIDGMTLKQLSTRIL